VDNGKAALPKHRPNVVGGVHRISRGGVHAT
jgi:hypothetical protein